MPMLPDLSKLTLDARPVDAGPDDDESGDWRKMKRSVGGPNDNLPPLKQMRRRPSTPLDAELDSRYQEMLEMVNNVLGVDGKKPGITTKKLTDLVDALMAKVATNPTWIWDRAWRDYYLSTYLSNLFGRVLSATRIMLANSVRDSITHYLLPMLNTSVKLVDQQKARELMLMRWPALIEWNEARIADARLEAQERRRQREEELRRPPGSPRRHESSGGAGPSVLLLMGPTEDPAPTPEQQEDSEESDDEGMWAARIQAMRKREKEEDEEWERSMGYARSRDGSPRMRSPRGREGQLDPSDDRWPWQNETAEREGTQEGSGEEEPAHTQGNEGPYTQPAEPPLPPPSPEYDGGPETILSRRPWSKSP